MTNTDTHPSLLGDKIASLAGPILVMGAGGFIGSNIFRQLCKIRSDVYGMYSPVNSCRVDDLSKLNLTRARFCETDGHSINNLLDRLKPKTVMYCIAHGSYPYQSNQCDIYSTNFILLSTMLDCFEKIKLSAFIHSGSSSEYGNSNMAPFDEYDPPFPNSHYSVSKIAASTLIKYYGNIKKFPCVNLRLFSVYGPYEDPSRLIPSVIRRGFRGGFPPFVRKTISRDFVYIDDVVEAFVDSALNLTPNNFGESYNICTGVSTSIEDVAYLAKTIFMIHKEPSFEMKPRDWDLDNWYGETSRTQSDLKWSYKTKFISGFQKTIDWYRDNKKQLQKVK